ANQLQGQQPDQHRRLVGQTRGVEERGPTAAGAVGGPLAIGQAQRRGYAAGQRAPELVDLIPGDIADYQLRGSLARVGAGLLEDQHARVIVDTPGLFGALVGNRNAEQSRVGRDMRDLLEAQLTAEQIVVVTRQRRVAHGHARGRAIHAVAAQNDVVGLVELVEQPLHPLAVVVGVAGVFDLVVLGVGGRLDADVAAAGILAVDVDRQAIVPLLTGQLGAGGNIVVDPA